MNVGVFIRLLFLLSNMPLRLSKICSMYTNLTATITHSAGELPVLVPMIVEDENLMSIETVDKIISPQLLEICTKGAALDGENNRTMTMSLENCVESGLQSLRKAIKDYCCQKQSHEKRELLLHKAGVTCKVILVSAYIGIIGYEPRGEDGKRIPDGWRVYLKRAISQIRTVFSIPQTNGHCMFLYSDDLSFLTAVSDGIAGMFDDFSIEAETAKLDYCKDSNQREKNKIEGISTAISGRFITKLINPEKMRNAAVAVAMKLPEDMPLKNGTPLRKGNGRDLAAYIWFNKFDLMAMAVRDIEYSKNAACKEELGKRYNEEPERQKWYGQLKEQGVQVQWRDIGMMSTLSLVGSPVSIPTRSILMTMYPKGVRSRASLSFGFRAPAVAFGIARFMVVNAADIQQVADSFHSALSELLQMAKESHNDNDGELSLINMSHTAFRRQLFLDEEIVIAWAAQQGSTGTGSERAEIWGHPSDSSLLSVVDLCSLPDVGCAASSDFSG